MVELTVIFLMSVLLLIMIKVIVDHYLHNHPKKSVNHGLSAAIDSFLYTVLAWVCFGWDAGPWILLALSMRWVLFDLLFNYANGWPLNFYGTTSWIDRQMRRLGRWHFVPKLLAVAISITLICL